MPYSTGQHTLLTSPVGNNGYPSFLVNDPSGIVTYTPVQNQIGFFTNNRTDLNFSIKYTINSACGTSISCVYFCNTNCLEFLMGPEPTLSIYPNPANTALKVQLKSSNLIQDQNESAARFNTPTSFQVKLFNDLGELVREAKTENGELMLDIVSLPAKSYFIHIIYNGKVVREQVHVFK